MFYDVTVGANAEGTTHLSSLFNATRGLAPTKHFVSKTFITARNPKLSNIYSDCLMLIHLHKLLVLLSINKVLNLNSLIQIF